MTIFPSCTYLIWPNLSPDSSDILTLKTLFPAFTSVVSGSMTGALFSLGGADLFVQLYCYLERAEVGGISCSAADWTVTSEKAATKIHIQMLKLGA